MKSVLCILCVSSWPLICYHPKFKSYGQSNLNITDPAGFWNGLGPSFPLPVVLGACGISNFQNEPLIPWEMMLPLKCGLSFVVSTV